MKTIRALAQPLVIVLGIIGIIALVAVLAAIFTTPWAALGLLGGLVVAWLVFRSTRSWVPRRTVLEIDLTRGIVEEAPASPLARVQAARAYPLLDLLDGLGRAAADKRVAGLVVRIGSHDPGVARAQEIATALSAFTESGKPAIAYAESLGELQSGPLASLRIGAACDRLYLQPGGELGITGLVQRKFYLRGALDKLGIVPQFDHRREYKSAMYTITEDHMVEPDREALNAYVGAQFDQLVAGIAEGRDLEAEQVQRSVDRAPLLAGEAVEAGLVDELLYRDELDDQIRTSWGAGARTLDISTYLKRAKRPHRRGPTVAVIYGTGLVTQGTSRFDPLTRQPSMGADDVGTAFRKAIADKKVKAIVFRIDSPGGSAVASNTMWRWTQRAVEAGKPVIASMGDVAASGGYYVACGATKIVAQPGTITGSIGVVAGKLVTRSAWERAGVTFDDVTRGANARFMGTQHPNTPGEEERFQALLDDVYDDFTGKVAGGRNKTREEVEALAKGRVWAGSDAYEHGLVDELGGIHLAARLAREAAGLDLEKSYRLTAYPKPKGPLGALLSRDTRDDDKLMVAELLEATAPLAQLAQAVEEISGVEVMRLPGIPARL